MSIVVLGEYSTTDILQRKFLEDLPAARQTLSQFSTLNMLFSSFSNYESKQYEKTRNVIFHLCLQKNHFGETDTRRLAEVEDALLIFGFANWSNADKSELKRRLCSDDFHESLTKYTELVYSKWLAEKIGRANVDIYPKLATGKVSDVLVKLDNKHVYLEIGNLNVSLPEQKIKQILDKGALYLWKKINGSVLMRLVVDLMEILTVDSKGHIDVQGSAKRLISEIDDLCIDKLSEFEGVLNISEIAQTLQYKEIIEKLLIWAPALISNNDKAIVELINSRVISQWIGATKDKIAEISKIVRSISRHSAKFPLVEIQPEMLFPTEAAIKERDSFITHIKNHIKNQFKQIQPKSPNIIVTQGYFDWFRFRFDEDLENIKPLSDRIRNYLDEKQQPYLSGIAFFDGDNFAKSVFIANEHSAKESKLSTTEVGKLGMQIVC